jgi:hypothetical protein
VESLLAVTTDLTSDPQAAGKGKVVGADTNSNTYSNTNSNTNTP